MKAIILAAGRGSRMGEKTADLPKCLMKLWGKTLLERQLAAIRKGGIEDICVVTGYLAEKVKASQPELTFFHNESWADTNMVSTLLKAEKWLLSDDCLISYADIVYEAEAVRLLVESTADIAVAYYTDFLQLWQKRFANPLDDLETFKTDKEAYLTEIGHRTASLEDIQGQYMGLLRITPAGWAKIRRAMAGDLPKPLAKTDMTALLSYLLLQGIKVKAIPYGGLWLEVDSPTDLALYENNPAIKRN